MFVLSSKGMLLVVDDEDGGAGRGRLLWIAEKDMTDG